MIHPLIHGYVQLYPTSYACCSSPAGKREKTSRDAPLTPSPPRGLSAPVERRGRYGYGRARPPRLGPHFSFRPRARAGPSVTFPFPSAPVRPTGISSPPLCFSLTRGPDHPKPGAKLSRKKRKPFYFTPFFPLTKEREIIFRGPPAPEPTASPAASRRPRGGPYPPRRRGRREEEEQYKEEGGSGSPGGEEASTSSRRRGRARAAASVISAAKVARWRRRGGCASGCRHPP
jgi:hypothetical protein